MKQLWKKHSNTLSAIVHYVDYNYVKASKVKINTYIKSRILKTFHLF